MSMFIYCFFRTNCYN